MATPLRRVKLSDEHWDSLAAIAEKVVPVTEVARHTPSGSTRVMPLLRMIADGKLIVVRPEDLKPRDE